MKKIVVPLFVILLCAGLRGDQSFIPLFIGEEKFIVELADTHEKRILGLMYRKNMPDDYGMLLVFDRAESQGIWMKNCRVSLDIIFLDQNKRVLNIAHDAPPCREEPCSTYLSEGDARYVLELRGNRANELGLKKGDTLFFVIPGKSR